VGEIRISIGVLKGRNHIEGIEINWGDTNNIVSGCGRDSFAWSGEGCVL
jgi:hypothetical protein